MIEVEMKLIIHSPKVVKQQLISCGFQERQYLKEVDRYFDNQHQQIRNADSALRVRTVTNLYTNAQYAQLNYKGARMDTVSMSRPEYETVVQDGPVMEQILNQLGYHAVEPSVVKVRQELVNQDMTACLDQVEGLGDFLELEIVVDSEAQKIEALKRIQELVERLGESVIESVNISYLSQLQDKMAEGL